MDALCGVWRILLVALSSLPAGLMRRLADMHPDVPWAYRPIFSFLAGEEPDAVFSLVAARAAVLRADTSRERYDADELERLRLPSREDVKACYEFWTAW